MKRSPYAIALLLDKRKPKGQNIVIGSDTVILRALERKFQVTIQAFDNEAPAYFSYLETELDVPAALRDSTSLWLNPPVAKNQELLKYLISALVPAMDKGQLEAFAKHLSADYFGFRDFNILYWTILTSHSNYENNEWLKDPWADPKNWTGKMDIGTRLRWLYTNALGHVYASTDNKQNLEKLGISKKKAEHLKALKISNNRLFRTIVELSKWRNKRQNDIQTALLITNIWES